MKRLPLVVLVLAIAVAACGGSSESAAGDAAAATTQAPATTTTTTTTTTEAPTTTAAPTTTTAVESGIVVGEDPEVDAVVTVYTVAFDSESDYAAKALYIDDPAGLEDTVARYLETGETMGGISVVVTAVEVNGDEAAVTYDLLFNNNPTYPNLPGTAVLTDDGWKVPRAVFCSLMSSARVGCPAE